MAFKREVEKVSIGKVEGPKDSKVLTLQITSTTRPLSIRERAGLFNAVRDFVRDEEGLTLGYHTAKKAAQGKAKKPTKPKRAKNSETAEATAPSDPV